jgi:hypothetical protein
VIAMKSYVFYNIMPYNPVKVGWCFGGTYHHDFQGWRVSQARNQHEAVKSRNQQEGRGRSKWQG